MPVHGLTIFDTDVLIDFQHNDSKAKQWFLQELRAGRLATTGVNLFEYASGLQRPNAKKLTEEFAGSFHEIYPLDSESAQLAGMIRSSLGKKGIGIGPHDSMIAGIAIRFDAQLVTRNRRHFERVEQLKLADY